MVSREFLWLMVRHEMKKNIRLIGYGFLGFVEGGLISVISYPLDLWLIILFLGLCLIFIMRAASSVQKAGHFLTLVVGVITVVLAILLPVKQLDGRVGPMQYERVTLYDLYPRLSKDWGVKIMPYDPHLDNTFVTFKTDKKMSRLEVLQKLAEETDSDLRIMYCGNGATFLFGAYPSFTTLRPRKAQQTSGGDSSARVAAGLGTPPK